MRKISNGNADHNNSLMETGLLANGLGINIPFTGEWGGSENCSVRAGSAKQNQRWVIALTLLRFLLEFAERKKGTMEE